LQCKSSRRGAEWVAEWVVGLNVTLAGYCEKKPAADSDPAPAT